MITVAQSRLYTPEERKYYVVVERENPLPDWDYMREVTIDNTQNSNTLSDFQVQITLDTASLISNGKMKSDCGDIRVYDPDKGSLLPYWVESGTENTSNTKIWVKVPSIPGGGKKTIYLFYGNPGATSQSNGDDVFEFFDDFEGTSLDTNKWEEGYFRDWEWYPGQFPSGTSTVVENSYYQVQRDSSGDSGAYPYPGIKYKGSLPRDNIAIYVKYAVNYDSSQPTYQKVINVVWLVDFANQKDVALRAYKYTYKSSDYNDDLKVWNGSEYVYESNIAWSGYDTWITAELRISGNVFKVYRNGDLVYSSSSWTNPLQDVSLLSVGGPADMSGGSAGFRIDKIIIRKYTDPEPTTSVGAEQPGGKIKAKVERSW